MISKLAFGNTGHKSTRTIFGGFSLSFASQTEANQLLDVLLKFEVNHIDTAANYGNSELRIGQWMDRYRSKFFLATKTEKRTYNEARDEFHHSLDRLRVDYVDLLQLHGLIDSHDWEIAMGLGGALEALIDAKEEGLTRFIGITSHGLIAPQMHMRSIENFAFDSILLPYNYIIMQNPKYANEFETLLTLCHERKVAVQTIKSIARGLWGDRLPTRITWYEPLEEQKSIDKMVHWVLGRPEIFLNTVGDVNLLPKVLDAANRFQTKPSEIDMRTELIDQNITHLWT